MTKQTNDFVEDSKWNSFQHFVGKTIRSYEVPGVNVVRFTFTDDTFVELETVNAVLGVHGFEATIGTV